MCICVGVCVYTCVYISVCVRGGRGEQGDACECRCVSV